MATCSIRWIDSAGNPTPDENPAIAEVQCEAYVEVNATFPRGFYRHEASAWFPICADHATRLREPGMEHWVVRAVTA